ncbi:MAG TPA: glycosyltransferase family 2 protein [Gemmataceae bacterium]|nr:glycosyltransferase family 2 protein [Gemmataceae bacterium]
MLLSIYTSVRNGLFFDYHVIDMLKHHLPLADEIVVNDGFSTDGTYERASALDPKIKVFRSDWGKPTGLSWLTRFKNDARARCGGRWCINLDCDEFIPEWEFEPLRALLGQSAAVIHPLRMINFYGNYKVFHGRPAEVPWPDVKFNVHRNRPDVEVYGDGSNVRLKDDPAGGRERKVEFSCHHFGFVRHPARLRQKWRNVLAGLYRTKGGGLKGWLKFPAFLFNWFPHDWADPQFLGDLELYEGPFVRAVRENPAEFVRDDFALYRRLKAGADSSFRETTNRERGAVQPPHGRGSAPEPTPGHRNTSTV